MTDSRSLGMATDLTAAGDRMQSEASRVLEWTKAWSEDLPCPYEVTMAMIGLKNAIDDWTAARSATGESE